MSQGLCCMVCASTEISLGNSWQIPLKWELPLQLVPRQGFTLGQSWKRDIAMGLLIVRWRCPNVGMWEEGGAN